MTDTQGSLNYLFAPTTTSAAVQGMKQRFPVRRIYCVGRNYAAHIREMGFDPSREPPFFFQKPPDALCDGNTPVPFPPDTHDFQFEVELVIAIGKPGAAITEATALEHIFGYAVGVDLTRRDRQIEARDRGRPWEVGKSFDFSAPMGPISPAAAVGHLKNGRIWLSANGIVKQDADLGQLIWTTAEVVASLSRSFRLAAGDLIFTGTPAGVGAVAEGDAIEVGIDGLVSLQFSIGKQI